MQLGEQRDPVAPSDLIVPACPLPRPGDQVVWYQNAVRYQGTLLGHTPTGKPFIRPRFGLVSQDLEFDGIRIENPAQSVGPIWRLLPEGGVIVRPRNQERDHLRMLLRQTVPPGVSHHTFAEEVWRRGFEVFLSRTTARAASVPGGPVAEIVTTMPLNRLYRLTLDMYGEKHVTAGELDLPFGRIQLGGLPGAADRYAHVRLFREDGPGTPNAVFGASFAQDLAHSDLACNAVFYDPINEVFIDPSGQGLADSDAEIVRPVCEIDRLPATERAMIGLCIIRCLALDYSIADGCLEKAGALVESMSAFTVEELDINIQREVLDHLPDGQDNWERIRTVLNILGREDVWDSVLSLCQIRIG